MGDIYLKLSLNFTFCSSGPKVNLSATKTRATAVKPEEKPPLKQLRPPSPPPPPPQHDDDEEEEEEEEEEMQSAANLLSSFQGDGGYGGDYDEY